MASKRKSWAEKMRTPAQSHVEITDKTFAGIPAGSRMLIPTPMIVRDYIEAIPNGQTRTIPQMRVELAARYDAETTCPLTSGIFARIVSEAALDDLQSGAKEITPFWRLVDPKSPLAKKLSCGPDFVRDARERESS